MDMPRKISMDAGPIDASIDKADLCVMRVFWLVSILWLLNVRAGSTCSPNLRKVEK